MGEIARERFPGGTLIDTDYDKISEAFDLTKEALENGASIIFEGVFSFDNVLVRPDVIKRGKNNDWELIEVKSSTKVKEENIHDVAVQKYVLKGAGIDVKKTHLMHINTKCTYPDLTDLFTLSLIHI